MQSVSLPGVQHHCDSIPLLQIQMPITFLKTSSAFQKGSVSGSGTGREDPRGSASGTGPRDNQLSLDKDKYLTPAPNLRRTRASHESQYCLVRVFSDVLVAFLYIDICHVSGKYKKNEATKTSKKTRIKYCQYTRYLAYSDALKNSFFPRTIPTWNSLPSSVVSSKTIEEFKAQI